MDTEVVLSQLNSLFCWELKVFCIFGINRSTFGLCCTLLRIGCVQFVIKSYLCVSLSFFLGLFYTKGMLQKHILSFPRKFLIICFFTDLTFKTFLCELKSRLIPSETTTASWALYSAFHSLVLIKRGQVNHFNDCIAVYVH